MVIKAVNDKLGESVSKMVETAELYVNVLNAAYSEFKDLKSTTEKSNKEAKSIFLTTSSISDELSKISFSSSTTDIGTLMVAVVTKIQEEYAKETMDLTGLLVTIGETVNSELGSSMGSESVSRGVLLVNVAKSMVDNIDSSDKTEGMTAIVKILSSALDVIKEGSVSSSTDIGSLTIMMCRNVQEAFAEESVIFKVEFNTTKHSRV